MSKQNIERLVAKYTQHRPEYINHNSLYSEIDIREEFINPFFEALGWDVSNQRNLSRRLREVVRETRLAIDEQTKRPDYEFRFGMERKFFVEAKRSNIDITTHVDSAFQVRRYGWSANVKISVLTNFEHLVIYDTTIQPVLTDSAHQARLYKFHYTEYVDKFEEIYRLISHEAIYSGQFDNYFANQTQNRSTEAIDKVFLQKLNQWRVGLAQDIIATHQSINTETINELAERFILRVLFLRMCEDRGIQTYQQLKRIADTDDWNQFVKLLREADQRFDSGLFATQHDLLCRPDAQRVRLNSVTVRQMIDSLYFPNASYNFAVFEPEFLGYVYEQFLHERITITNNIATLKPKPENQGRDVVPTPQPIIQRIVQDTLQPILQNLTFEQLLQKQLLDPACGSGGFLIATFGLLVEIAINGYLANQDQTYIYKTLDGWQLLFEKKCELLHHCIYGVDRDFSAVEVAKFSLVVKLLEDEIPTSLPANQAILPSLDRNIMCGDSLVDKRIYETAKNPALIGIPITWGEDLPKEFDAVIGNPPYMKTEDIKNLEAIEYSFYTQKGNFVTAYQQFDKYYLFIERIIQDWLKPNGVCGMVVSRKFTNIESGKMVRRLLSKDAHISRMVDFGNAQMFEGRTTYTCLLFFTKSTPNPLASFIYERINSPQDWLKQYQANRPTMQLSTHYISSDKAWILPNNQSELELLQAISNNTVTLSNLVDIFNGIQTSQNAVYVLTEWQDEGDIISFSKHGQTWQIEKAILKPFYEGHKSELHSFYPLPTTAWLIFPYFIKNYKQATPIPPQIMQTDYPLAYSWLKYNQATLAERDISPQPYPPDEWYRYGRQQSLSSFENRPKIIVGINSLGDKYVYDESNTFLASGGTAGECAIAHLRDNPTDYSLYFIHALLNHKAVEYFCRKRGSPFRGGWFARGTAVLKEIPIPLIDFTTNNTQHSLYQEVVQANQHLHEICHKLTLTTSNREREQLERHAKIIKTDLDQIIARLYNVEKIIQQIELPT